MRAPCALTATVLVAVLSVAGVACASERIGTSTGGPTTGTTVAVTSTVPERAEPPVATAGPTTGGTTSMPRPSLAERADELCAGYRTAVEANGPPQIDGFDPDDPNPDLLPSVAAHFAPVLDAARVLSIELADLEGGSADETARLVALVGALDAENRNATLQATAGAAADVNAFTATLAQVEPLATARIDAARTLGAPACALP